MLLPARRFAAHGCSLGLIALASIGCRPAEEIRTYRIAKPDAETPSAATAEVAAPAERGEPDSRMLAAVIPGPQQAWFFKATGSQQVMASLEDDLRSLYSSVRFGDDGPEWDLPDGWRSTEGSGMRFATLTPAAESSNGVEVSVIGLPKTGDWSRQVDDNLVRWAKQLGQGAETVEAAKSSLALADASDEGAVLYDQVGWFDGGASMAPFAGGGSAPRAPAQPPVASRPPAASPPASGGLTFDRPDGWVDEPGSAMRKASLRTPADAVVTAFSFPAVAEMADPLANVNRWRGEVALEPIEQAELDGEDVRLLGETGLYYELIGPEKATLVAMLTRGQAVWFFKLTGPKAAAEADREAFRGWLASLSI